MVFTWSSFKNFRALLRETAPPAAEMASRLKTVERDIILPVLGFFHPPPFTGIRWWFSVKSGTRSGRDGLGDNGEPG